MALQIGDRHNISRQMVVNSDGSININTLSGMIDFSFDYISLALTDSVTEVYTFRQGGSGGTVVATLTLVWDGTKVTSVTRT